MNDVIPLLKSLRSLAMHKHSDHSIADNAADEIVKLLDCVSTLKQQRDDAQHFLRIYFHAHKHGNSVPPTIVGGAELTLKETAP